MTAVGPEMYEFMEEGSSYPASDTTTVTVVTVSEPNTSSYIGDVEAGADASMHMAEFDDITIRRGNPIN